MTENMTEADSEYAKDVLVVGVPEAFTNSLLSGPCPRQARITPYYSALIMFVYALSFKEKDLHHLTQCW
jgi:hypothetical protein